MARDQDVKRGPATAEQEPASAKPEVESTTKFDAKGPLPAVAASQGPAPAPTASELAFDPGPGVQALEALLATGTATPKQVVELIDANRGESAAMFALVESKVGSGFVTEVRDAMGLRASIKRKELVAGDPTGTGGFFVASEKEQGARWRTNDGSFDGKVNKDGLDSTWRMDSNDSLHAHTDKSGNGALGWEHDGKTMAELYKNNSEFGLRHTWDVDGGKLDGGLRHRGEANEAFGSYKSTDGKLTADAGLGIRGGGDSEHLAATYKPNDRNTFTGTADHDVTGTRFTAGASHKLDNGGTVSGNGELAFLPEGTTGRLGAAYSDSKYSVDGNVTRGLDQTSLHLGASDKLNPNTTISGSLDHTMKARAGAQSTLHLAERYRSGNIVQSADLELGRGERNYLSGTTGFDAQLGKNFYGGAFGGFRAEEGHQTGAQLGASLTFTPHEKAALTLAGVLDQTGQLETRLQLDVFKSKIGGVGDIADHKKDALLSLFVSYSTGANRGMLDERYGAATMSTTPDPKVMAGIKIKF